MVPGGHMSRLSRAGLTVLLLATVITASAVAQSRTYTWSSTHYLIQTDSGEMDALEYTTRMEAALELFNGLFHFDLSRLPDKLRVRIFGTKEDYDRYLRTLIDETREDFVFISYSDPTRSELVGFRRPDADLNASLLHYGFIQYLNAFVRAAPLWLEEGMAAYVEYSAYDSESDAFLWRPNYAWLDTLKGILRDPQTRRYGLMDLLTIDKPTAYRRIELFYPAAWGLVEFLMHTPERRYNRIIWDSISALMPRASLAENSRLVVEKGYRWVDMSVLEQSFRDYILSLKTFQNLVSEGVQLYNQGKLDEGEESFRQAADRRPDSYIPPYYLGLIAYDRRNYQQAFSEWSRAQKLGVDQGLISYALGVNAFADKKYDLAERYLREARRVDPGAYADKVEALLRRIEVLR